MILCAQKYCAQGKGFQVVRAASQYAFEKFSKYFNCAIQGQFSFAFFRIWLPPMAAAIRTSGAARFFNSMLVFD